jgi:ADP-glucose pyrophosphorylase
MCFLLPCLLHAIHICRFEETPTWYGYLFTYGRDIIWAEGMHDNLIAKVAMQWYVLKKHCLLNRFRQENNSSSLETFGLEVQQVTYKIS